MFDESFIVRFFIFLFFLFTSFGVINDLVIFSKLIYVIFTIFIFVTFLIYDTFFIIDQLKPVKLYVSILTRLLVFILQLKQEVIFIPFFISFVFKFHLRFP
jgi:hypothetical protein